MVFVLDKNKKPLSPCHEARARLLLKNGKAAVFRRFPFTIILKREVEETPAPMELKIDPGSKHTGLAILRGNDVVWLGQIEHKTSISSKMEKRAGYRRRRRSKKRYRPARFDNRKKPEGWFPPTVMSRLQNIVTWADRLSKICPITKIQYELVKFDTQLMMNPDIKGKEYQEGPLYNTEMRTFLLTTFQGVCQYCNGASRDKIKEWEHKIPKSRGGSNSVSNATLACHKCNQEKGNLTPKEWEAQIREKKKRSKLDESRLEGIAKVEKQSFGRPLADAAITNAIRKKIKVALQEALNIPVVSSPARNTKRNRVHQHLPKEHCVDAACVGKNIPLLKFRERNCVVIEAIGRGSHCRTNVNSSGFPKGYLPRMKQFFGFQTGQMVKAITTKGNTPISYEGRVACRSTGYFKLKIARGKAVNVKHTCLKILSLNDGYSYSQKTIL